MLVINTVNSIELLTDARFTYKSEKGVIELRLEKDGGLNCIEAVLLISSLHLGLKSVKEEYGKYIELSEVSQ
jgi:uncharacterized protein YsxB (DUF464 family)